MDAAFSSIEIARQLEANEAAAYRSFFAAATAVHGAGHFDVVDIAGATALRSKLVANDIFNRVIGLGLNLPITEQVLNDLKALYTEYGRSPILELVPCVRTPELKTVLREHKIRRSFTATNVLCRHLSLERYTPGPVKIAPASQAQWQTVADICSTVFSMPKPIHEVLAMLGSVPGWTPWLAWVDDVPAAAAMTYREADRCWFGWAATLPVYRGRGVKGSLDRARVNSAVESGCRFISTETTAVNPNPSSMSLQRIGFTTAYERATYFQTV